DADTERARVRAARLAAADLPAVPRARAAAAAGAAARVADGRRALALPPWPSMTLEGDEGPHRHVELAQLGGAAEIGQIDDEAGGEHLRAELAQQLDRALGGATGGAQGVDQDHPVALLDRVLVHFHLFEAVFERVPGPDPH